VKSRSRLTGNSPDHRAPRVFPRGFAGHIVRTHLDPGETRPARIATAGTGALPGIGADVVMVAAGRQEHSLAAISGYRVEAELLVPPGFGFFRPADAQMDMADDAVFRRTLPARIAGRYFGDKGRNI